jgi:hypothetical protein
MDMNELITGKGIINLKKYRLGEFETEQELIDRIDKGIAIPFEEKESHNIWLTSGWTELLSIISGDSANHFNAANTKIGVGIDATAASAAQTDLIGATTKYVGLSSGYPTTPSAGTIQYKARFTTSDANFAHNELVIKNSVSGVCWNRNATGWGTKDATMIFDYLIQLGKA